MINLTSLKSKHAPKAHLGNFWRSVDCKAAMNTLRDLEPHDVKVVTRPAPGTPATTMVHPLIGLAFMRWVDPNHFYTRLQLIITQ